MTQWNPWELRIWQRAWSPSFDVEARILMALGLHEAGPTPAVSRTTVLVVDTELLAAVVFVPSDEMPQRMKESLLEAIGLEMVQQQDGSAALAPKAKADRKAIVL